MVHGDEEADIAFLDTALAATFARCRIDPARIAIAGFSDGATAALCWGLVNGALFSAIAAFSPGFVHVAAAPEGRPRIFISHGTRDPVFPVERCGRPIAGTLRTAGYAVDYREFDGGHAVPGGLAVAGLDSLLIAPRA
jgi:phospholipase/carboxylesterase